MLTSRGVKGSDVIEVPQLAQCQSPEMRGFSTGEGAASNPSSTCGSLARVASKGKSDISSAVAITGAVDVLLPFCLP